MELSRRKLFAALAGLPLVGPLLRAKPKPDQFADHGMLVATGPARALPIVPFPKPPLWIFQNSDPCVTAHILDRDSGRVFFSLQPGERLELYPDKDLLLHPAVAYPQIPLRPLIWTVIGADRWQSFEM